MKTASIVLFHGDFDGIVSAALLIKKLALSDYSLFPAEPFTVDRAMKKMAEYKSRFDNIYMVDIAPNNKNFKMTRKFISGCAKISETVTLYDHHNGWENFCGENNVVLNVRPGAPSCAGYLYDILEYSNSFAGVLDELAADADIIDTGGYEGISKTGSLLYRALKADMKDPHIKIDAVRFILSDLKDAEILRTLNERDASYGRILENSFAVLPECREVAPGICYLNVDDHPCDITVIIKQCYKKYKTAVVEYFSGGNRFYIIATSRNDLDLLERLDMWSGVKSRVTIVKCDLEGLLAKII